MNARVFADCLVADADVENAMLDMVNTSFFLPEIVRKRMTDIGWIIHPIQVVSNEEFWKSVPILEAQEAYMTFTPSEYLVKRARKIGVSIRTNAIAKECVVIAKMWEQSVFADRNQVR